MKVLIKKTYCPACLRLVNGKEQKANNTNRILCSRCGRVLWREDALNWRSVKEAE